MHERSRHLPEALVLLLVVLALLPGAAAEPVLIDQGGGAKRVTWDFSTAADYNLTDVAVAPGIATLAQTPLWRNYTSDSDFLASEDSATNVSVSSGLRPQGLPQSPPRTFSALLSPRLLVDPAKAMALAQTDPIAASTYSPSSQPPPQDVAMTG